MLLKSLTRYKSLNDTYINVARLRKPSFFVIHHDVNINIDKLRKITRYEHNHGWKSNLFLRANPDTMNQKIGRRILKMGHDIGFLYDSLSLASRVYAEMPQRDVYRHAWLHFQNVLKENITLNMTAISCFNHDDGVDNLCLWKDFDYRTAGIRCNTDAEFAHDVVYIYIRTDGISFRVMSEGRVLDKGDESINDIKELCSKIRKADLVDRLILRITWE